MSKHYPPEFEARQFHCVHCEVFASQEWGKLHYLRGPLHEAMGLTYCQCGHCRRWSYWYEGRMIVPVEAPVPPPHSDMPSECIPEYNEARNIVALSPRA